MDPGRAKLVKTALSSGGVGAGVLVLHWAGIPWQAAIILVALVMVFILVLRGMTLYFLHKNNPKRFDDEGVHFEGREPSPSDENNEAGQSESAEKPKSRKRWWRSWWRWKREHKDS